MFYVSNYYGRIKTAPSYQKKTTREKKDVSLRTMKRLLTISIGILLFCFAAAGMETSPEVNAAQQTEEGGRQTGETKKAIKGFCGGMMVHTGYQFGGDNPRGYQPNGATFGLGGVAKVQLTKHFRAGAEGYFSSVDLTQDVMSGSHNKIFWAGALVDWFCQRGRFYPYAGLSVGGGMETSLYMFQGNTNDWKPETEIIYRKQPFAYVDPFIGCDFAAGKAIRFTVKADWLLAFNNEGLNRPLGPRIYFGIIFAR